jgi:hypothetical protein
MPRAEQQYGPGPSERGPARAGPERRKAREELLAECRIRSESFVDEVRGGRRGRQDKEP